MIKLKNIFYYLVIAILFQASCKVPKSAESAVIQMPASFGDSKDNENSGTINWKSFFSYPELVSLIDTALKNNLDLLIMLQRIEVARSDLRLTKGLALPTISASTAFWQRKFGRYTMDQAGNMTTEIEPGKIVPNHLPDYYVGLQTSWEIDIWGKLRNKKKAALSRYLSSLEGRNWAITNLASDVALNYYELLALDNNLNIIRETIKLQQDALEIVTVQKEGGMANELAVQQFEAQLINSKTIEKEVLQSIIETENKLNFLLGRYPQPIKRDTSSFSNSLPNSVKVGIPADLLKNRPDIKQAEFDLMASKADVVSAKAAFYPSLNITGGIGFQSFDTKYLFSTPQSVAYSILGNLTAPLINRSAIKASFRTARANQVEAMYNYQKSIINGYVEVYNEIVNIKNLEDIQKLRNSQVNILTRSIETSSDLHKTGRANYLEVLTAQEKALEAKFELVNVKKRQYHSIVNLYKALGGGWK